MHQPYSLRPATDNDYEFLYQLHLATIKPAVEATWGWDEIFQQERFRSHWDPTQRQIIQVNGIDIGTITLQQRETTVFLALIEVAPDYQGQGIGTALIREVISEAHQRGLTVELQVLKANVPARQLYERIGFRITEEQAERYVMTIPPSPNKLEAE
jgi:ribosomal protein S18 acetylase RimI-like enzyme